MSLRNSLLILGFIAAWLAGWVYYADIKNEATRQRNEQYARDMKDMSVPPVLSDRQTDPSWTIAYWLSVGEKSSDCVTADDYMDRNAISKTVTRNGNSKTYYLKDYVESCQNRIPRNMEMVEPATRKWCAYRQTNLRLETLCREWEQNKDIYLARFRASDEPTLSRYRAFIGQ
jgi:hypothetical protein